MILVTNRIEVEVDPAALYDFLADPERLPEWLAGVTTVDVKHPGHPEHAVVHLQLAGVPGEAHLEWVEAVPPRRLAWESTFSTPMRFRAELLPGQRLTRLDVTWGVEPSSTLLARFGDPGLRRVLRKHLELSLVSVKERCEHAARDETAGVWREREHRRRSAAG